MPPFKAISVCFWSFCRSLISSFSAPTCYVPYVFEHEIDMRKPFCHTHEKKKESLNEHFHITRLEYFMIWWEWEDMDTLNMPINRRPTRLHAMNMIHRLIIHRSEEAVRYCGQFLLMINITSFLTYAYFGLSWFLLIVDSKLWQNF